MWPDRFGRRPRRDRAGAGAPNDRITRIDGGIEDPALTGLAEELSRAGFVARRAAYGPVDGPSPAFAMDLRARLLAGFAPMSAVGALVSPMGVAVPPVPRVSPRRILPAPRWTALGAAAILLLSVIGLNASLLRPEVPAARASAVSGATLIRDGVASKLAAGTDIRVGDEVRVAADGRATITIGATEARLAGGADLRIDLVSADRIVVDQVAGRVYHRVVVNPGGTYTVETASLDWIARGTAFDLDRMSIDEGGRLTLTAVQHEVGVNGPTVRATIEERQQAVASVGDTANLSIGEAPESALRDPWLVANARLDLALGYPLGIFKGVDLSEPSASSISTAAPSTRPSPAGPSPETTHGPTADPTTTQPPPMPTSTPSTPTGPRSPGPTPRPTPRPTPKATPKPTPTPSSKPTSSIEPLSFTASACPGGVVLDWASFGGGGFDHYLVLRSTSTSIPAAYPPQDGARVVGGTYTTERSKTDGYDRIGRGGATAHYRAIAFDHGNHALAASAVQTVKTKPVKRLGALAIESSGSSTRFDWSTFAGPAGCYTAYKLAYSADDSTPSYLDGDPIAWVGTNQDVGTAFVEGLRPGTYWFRLQAIRATSLGKFVVAQTGVVRYKVP
jgi:hypothetical protein